MPIAEINGQGIFYEDSGGDGPPVIFLHGFLFDQSMFDPQVEVLAPKYRCIRFDARAFGQTQWDGKPFSLYDTAADAIGLLDHLGIQEATFVGMSQGGYALVRIAIKYKERVKAAVFLSTYNGVDTPDVKQIYYSMRNTWVKQGPDPLISTYRDLFLGKDERGQELFKYWEPRWRAVSAKAFEAASNNLTERDEIPDEQVKEHITMPSIVIHGEQDQGMPIALAEQLYKTLPNAKRMVPVPGAAHAANLTHPDVVNEALQEFLAEIYP
ncbi:MAG: alpha/beta hydrolase [Phototrophicales bacterium]|nr:MAG: alpha/beta hydrolase [Phototrophicales bacterium]